MQSARRYYLQGKWHNFRPDATVLYEQGGSGKDVQRWLFWLEWDEGTMSQEQLRDKMHTYAYYMRSMDWRRGSTRAERPVLLFVTPEPGQADRLCELAAEILGETSLQVNVAIRALVEERGVFAPIWFQAVPIEKDPTKQRVLKKPMPWLGS
jgi:hypothetical protein